MIVLECKLLNDNWGRNFTSDNFQLIQFLVFNYDSFITKDEYLSLTRFPTFLRIDIKSKGVLSYVKRK